MKSKKEAHLANCEFKFMSEWEIEPRGWKHGQREISYKLRRQNEVAGEQRYRLLCDALGDLATFVGSYAITSPITMEGIDRIRVYNWCNATAIVNVYGEPQDQDKKPTGWDLELISLGRFNDDFFSLNQRCPFIPVPAQPNIYEDEIQEVDNLDSVPSTEDDPRKNENFFRYRLLTGEILDL